MKKKIIECTPKQYEVLRAIVRKSVRDLETRVSYTKQKHCSRRNEVFHITLNWRNVRSLQRMKDQFK